MSRSILLVSLFAVVLTNFGCEAPQPQQIPWDECEYFKCKREVTLQGPGVTCTIEEEIEARRRKEPGDPGPSSQPADDDQNADDQDGGQDAHAVKGEGRAGFSKGTGTKALAVYPVQDWHGGDGGWIYQQGEPLDLTTDIEIESVFSVYCEDFDPNDPPPVMSVDTRIMEFAWTFLDGINPLPRSVGTLVCGLPFADSDPIPPDPNFVVTGVWRTKNDDDKWVITARGNVVELLLFIYEDLKFQTVVGEFVTSVWENLTPTERWAAEQYGIRVVEMQDDTENLPCHKRSAITLAPS